MRARMKAMDGGLVRDRDAEDSRAAKTSVRLAQNEADIAAMVALGRALHAESWFRALPLDEIRLAEIGRRGLAKGIPA